MRYAEYVQQIEHLKVNMEDVRGILETRGITRWAYLVHDRDEKDDGTPIPPHLHIEMELKCDNTPATVAKWFDDEPQYIEKGKYENKNHAYENMCSYLIHDLPSADGKYHYDPHEVTANFDFVAFIEEIRNNVKKAAERAKQKKENIDDVLDMIADNKITRLDIDKHLTNIQQIKHSRQIEQAFSIRDRRLATEEINRKMEVIYIHGDAGTGKTWYAKNFAQNLGYHVFISGSSNDPLEGYIGQEAIILDDFRGSDWKINDLLKLLDNNTTSRVKSRYSNKLMNDCKLIIITSVQTIEEAFSGLQESNNEAIHQLKRRCSTKMLITEQECIMSVYDQRQRRYVEVSRTINPFSYMKNMVQNNPSIVGAMLSFVDELNAQNKPEELTGESIELVPFVPEEKK